MAHHYHVEYTDTFGGEANYSWVRRADITVPELIHYGYTGSTDGSYAKANKRQQREAVKQAKAAMGLTGVRGETEDTGEGWIFRPRGMCTVMFVTWQDAPETDA